MTDKRPARFDADVDLGRMLRDLGRDGQTTERDATQESAREARMAASIDAEVASLNRARRRRRALFVVAAVAASIAVTLGLRHASVDVASVHISPEPVAASSGGRSPRSAAPRPALSPAPSAVAVASAVTRANPTPSVAAPLASATEPQSTLAKENQLFKEAAEAGRDGDVSGALARLDQLLVEHPASPLAQTAMVRKFRLLAKAGRNDEARQEAERYLSAYPSGFAVTEALALKAGGGESNAP